MQVYVSWLCNLPVSGLRWEFRTSSGAKTIKYLDQDKNLRQVYEVRPVIYKYRDLTRTQGVSLRSLIPNFSTKKLGIIYICLMSIAFARTAQIARSTSSPSDRSLSSASPSFFFYRSEPSPPSSPSLPQPPLSRSFEVAAAPMAAEAKTPSLAEVRSTPESSSPSSHLVLTPLPPICASRPRGDGSSGRPPDLLFSDGSVRDWSMFGVRIWVCWCWQGSFVCRCWFRNDGEWLIWLANNLVGF